ncbi:GIY-YIG nuclease family protein [Robertmurraya siralis]|uniref:GIY-YIG nuclease family protein n=1 Tax=Robertmurraya siralis TaxID=77777 RepID=UPI0010F902DD|nr:GIY-YIG nuclease family protein [Robertmurraya siralis]
MVEIINPSHTLYSIHLHISDEIKVEVGKLGSILFKKGEYIYVGSAKRNIIARINRHIKEEKVQKWHFDYLRPHGIITKIITYETSIGECQLAEKLRKESGGCWPVKKFGSTDCKCPSHLIFVASS